MMDRVAEMLSSMCDRGIRLWADEGRLCYQAPAGALTARDKAALRNLKTQILDFLQRSDPNSAAQPPLKPRSSAGRVPLSPMQKWWWKMMRPCGALRSMRVLFDSNRISGPLNIEALRRSLDLLVRRHESLRTRIVEVDGELMHEIEAARPHDLEIIDLPPMSATELEAQARRLLDEVVQEATGPLFRVRLVKLGDQDHVLIAAMQHIVSDGISTDVLARDMWTSYVDFVTGAPCSLPALPIQYADYVAWQNETQQWWLNRHAAYWKEHYFDAPDVKLPVDDVQPDGRGPGSAEEPINFGTSVSRGLRELCRRERTTLMVGVMTAYAAMLLRWQKKSDLVLGYIVTGRYLPEFENLIGFFARPLYSRVQLKDDDTFFDLLRRVAHEYQMAYVHFDVSLAGLPDNAEGRDRAASYLNWLPNYGGNPGSAIVNDRLAQSEHALGLEPFPVSECKPVFDDAADPQKRQAFSLMLWDAPDGITGYLSYRTHLMQASTAERLVRNLRSFAATLARNPQTRIAAMSIADSDASGPARLERMM